MLVKELKARHFKGMIRRAGAEDIYEYNAKLQKSY